MQSPCEAPGSRLTPFTDAPEPCARGIVTLGAAFSKSVRSGFHGLNENGQISRESLAVSVGSVQLPHAFRRSMTIIDICTCQNGVLLATQCHSSANIGAVARARDGQIGRTRASVSDRSRA